MQPIVIAILILFFFGGSVIKNRKPKKIHNVIEFPIPYSENIRKHRRQKFTLRLKQRRRKKTVSFLHISDTKNRMVYGEISESTGCETNRK